MSFGHGGEDPVFPTKLMPPQVLDNCQIQEWYPNFHRLTIKTKFIELTEPFVEYLLSDGIILPVSDLISADTDCAAVQSCALPDLLVGQEGIELHKSSNQEDEDSWSDTSWDEAGMGSRPGNCPMRQVWSYLFRCSTNF